MNSMKILQNSYVLIGVILVSLTMISLLTIQNYKLRGLLEDKDAQYKMESQQKEFTESLELRMLRRTFPIEISNSIFSFPDGGFQKNRKHIVMVFNLTVCGSCLDEHLRYINRIKDKIKQKDITMLAVIGINDEKEKSEVVVLHESGRLPFPYAFLIAAEVDELLGISKKDNYLDTPVYFLLDTSSVVESIIKPDGPDTTLLGMWLRNIQ